MNSGQSCLVGVGLLDVQSVTDMVSLKEGANVLIRCAIHFDTVIALYRHFDIRAIGGQKHKNPGD